MVARKDFLGMQRGCVVCDDFSGVRAPRAVPDRPSLRVGAGSGPAPFPYIVVIARVSMRVRNNYMYPHNQNESGAA